MRLDFEASTREAVRFLLGFLGMALLLKFVPLLVRYALRTFVMNAVFLVVGVVTLGLIRPPLLPK